MNLSYLKNSVKYIANELYIWLTGGGNVIVLDTLTAHPQSVEQRMYAAIFKSLRECPTSKLSPVLLEIVDWCSSRTANYNTMMFDLDSLAELSVSESTHDEWMLDLILAHTGAKESDVYREIFKTCANISHAKMLIIIEELKNGAFSDIFVG